MISRRSGDDIAAQFSKILQDMKASKSSQGQNPGKVATASSEGLDNSAHDSGHLTLDSDPASFLESSVQDPHIENSIDEKIENLSNYSKDSGEYTSCADDCEGCEKCESHADDCKCCECTECEGCNKCWDMSDDGLDDDEEGVASLVSDASKNVLFGLGKIASELREKEEHFAADMVEATAFGIISDLKKEASKKLHVISELKKIASSVDPKDSLAADLIQVTINKIKKG